MRRLFFFSYFVLLLHGTVYSQILKDSVFYYDAKMEPTSKKIAFVEKVIFTTDSSYTCVLFDKKTNVVRRKMYFTNEIPSSDWEFYDENGTLTSKKNYAPDNYKPVSRCDSAKIAKMVGTLRQFVLKNLRYPVLARENGIQGKVIYQIRIDEKGSMTKLSILKSNSRFLTEEVIRVILQSVTPNMLLELSQKGCESIITLPVTFKLQT